MIYNSPRRLARPKLWPKKLPLIIPPAAREREKKISEPRLWFPAAPWGPLRYHGSLCLAVARVPRRRNFFNQRTTTSRWKDGRPPRFRRRPRESNGLLAVIRIIVFSRRATRLFVCLRSQLYIAVYGRTGLPRGHFFVCRSIVVGEVWGPDGIPGGLVFLRGGVWGGGRVALWQGEVAMVGRVLVGGFAVTWCHCGIGCWRC